MISIRAMIEARTASTRDGMRAYARMAGGEPGTHWSALAQELQTLITSVAASGDPTRSRAKNR